MKRREFLKATAVLGSQTLLTSSLAATFWLPTASGGQVSVQTLAQALDPEDGFLIVPKGRNFNKYVGGLNLRTLKSAMVRVMCLRPKAAAVAIQWAQVNGVHLAMRSGGHSYEGLSQSNGMVIDTRLMNDIQIDTNTDRVSMGSGSMLGPVYLELAKNKMAIPAGSCPTVGATGHTMGGGFGLLSRPFGLACDSLISVQLADAKGALIDCSEDQNADLFWALRGGGGGSFGVVTRLEFRTHALETVHVYGVTVNANIDEAARVMEGWQNWIGDSPKEITSFMRIVQGENGMIKIRFAGQTIGGETQLRRELKKIVPKILHKKINIQKKSFGEAVRHFGGSFEEQTAYWKGKSDYLNAPMNLAALKVFLKKLPDASFVVFDGYGGAISDVAADATAFPHRKGTLCGLQYYTQWAEPEQGEARMLKLRKFHEALRPYMTGGAYFNYCDLDIPNYARAYWGANLERLVQVKNQYDPENFFRHEQSVPLTVKRK